MTYVTILPVSSGGVKTNVFMEVSYTPAVKVQVELVSAHWRVVRPQGVETVEAEGVGVAEPGPVRSSSLALTLKLR